MKKKNIQDLKQHKAEELFSLSHRLLDVAKELSEYHASELRINIEHAKELAIATAKSDFKQVERLQKTAAVQAAQRMKAFQKNTKALLRKMGNESAEKVEKYFEKAQDSLLDWLDESEKKIPVGAEKLSKVVHSFSSAGAKAFKEGRKLVNDAADNVDALIDKTVGEKIPVKKVVSKKPMVKKIINSKADLEEKNESTE